jgi:DegV family protein with EDD domain
MPSPVTVITDSTASIPEDIRAELNITAAPNLLHWGGETLRDGVDIQPAAFYERLATSRELPTTAQVPPAAFGELFDEAHARGQDVLCIIMSPAFSGTYQSALLAQKDRPGRNIVVLDSLASGMATGWAAITTARLASSGAGLAACRAYAERAIPNTGVIGMLDTLKYLHRSGRIGAAKRFLGSALNLKPLLEIADSAIAPLEQVRTHRRAFPRMVEILRERIGGRKPLRLAVMHANSPEPAARLRELAAAELKPIEVITTDLSPALGANFGEGTLGICYLAGDSGL